MVNGKLVDPRDIQVPKSNPDLKDSLLNPNNIDVVS
jgi:hypothetical protein